MEFVTLIIAIIVIFFVIHYTKKLLNAIFPKQDREAVIEEVRSCVIVNTFESKLEHQERLNEIYNKLVELRDENKLVTIDDIYDIAKIRVKKTED